MRSCASPYQCKTIYALSVGLKEKARGAAIGRRSQLDCAISPRGGDDGVVRYGQVLTLRQINDY